MPEELTRKVSDVVLSWKENLDKVAAGDMRIIITRHGTQVAAMIPIQDYQKLKGIEASQA